MEDVTERKTMENRLQSTMEQLRFLSHRLLEVQEKERRYLAGELHDEMGQVLTALRFSLKRAERGKTGESKMPEIDESLEMVDGLIKRVRNLSIELRPAVLDDFGLTAALDWYVNWLSAKTGLKMMLHAGFTEERFLPLLELTCFRIAQEALTNAARHSDAKEVHVDLARHTGELHLTVRDDGSGFDAERIHETEITKHEFRPDRDAGACLPCRGSVEITSQPGQGTVVQASFPLELILEKMRYGDEEKLDKKGRKG